MTAAVPFATREVGQRLNAMAQGGLPVDVAGRLRLVRQSRLITATVAAVRVCVQMMLGPDVAGDRMASRSGQVPEGQPGARIRKTGGDLPTTSRVRHEVETTRGHGGVRRPVQLPSR